MYYILQEF